MAADARDRTKGKYGRRLKVGPVRVWSNGTGEGYKARCSLCTWESFAGSYVWDVQERARQHIAREHDRRCGQRRRADRREGSKP